MYLNQSKKFPDWSLEEKKKKNSNNLLFIYLYIAQKYLL